VSALVSLSADYKLSFFVYFPVQEESHSTPALLTSGGPTAGHSAVSLGMIPEHSLLESCARLSVSLEGPGIFNVPSHSGSSSSRSSRSGSHHMTMDELRAVNRYAESTKSLSYLPQVRECLIPSSSHVNTQAKVTV
jgi:Rho GTPase-activating protein 20